MLRGLAILLLVALSATTPATAQTTYAPKCLDPPGNGPIADVVVNALEALRPIIYNGIPQLGIPVLDPFGPLPSLSLSLDNPVIKLDASINDTMIRYLGQYIVCQVNISLGFKPKFDVILELENFRMDGVYDINGLVVWLFPIFGNGNFSVDLTNSGVEGAATLSYNIIHDRLSIKDLVLDVFFDDLHVEFENLMGGGDMGEAINNYISELGATIFRTVWDLIAPVLSSVVEEFINNALYNISISDIIPKELDRDLGNANDYLDMVMENTAELIIASGLEPASLPDATLNLGDMIHAELVNGTLAGLSTIRRSGTATVDTVTDWIFLYANVAIGPLEAVYPGVVTNGDGTTDEFVATVGLEIIDVYLTARGDVYNYVLDLDQFVITEMGSVNVEIRGLGVLGWLAGPITEGITNLFMDDIQELLSKEIKEALQNVLNENPWPGQ